MHKVSPFLEMNLQLIPLSWKNFVSLRSFTVQVGGVYVGACRRGYLTLKVYSDSNSKLGSRTRGRSVKYFSPKKEFIQ